MSATNPWDMLRELPAWQVTEVPRPDGDGTAGADDWGAEERVAALVSAYGCGAPVAVAWVRDRPGGPVRVLVAGPGLVAGPAVAEGADCGQAVLTVPAGARGMPLSDGDAARMLGVLPCWTRVAGVTDVLLAEAREQRASADRRVGPSLERGLLSAWLDAFAWLLLAEPVGAGAVTEMAAQAASAQLAAEQNSSPRTRLAARRAGARHDELREAGTSGLWRVHLLAGAASSDAAARVARLVCSSADLRGLPYGLTPRPVMGSLPDTLRVFAGSGGVRAVRHAAQHEMTPEVSADRSWWDAPMTAGPWAGPASADGRPQWPQPGPDLSSAEAFRLAQDERDTLVPESPFAASTRLVAALARAPGREVPGLRLTLRPQFDITPETVFTSYDGDRPGVIAGTVLDWNRVPAGPLTLPLTSLNRHVFVCGATGSGKSQTVRGLLEQATAVGIPWLVVEPAKAEYRLMAARLPGAGVICIRPGDLGHPAAGFNPLEPAPGPGPARFPLQTHADLLRALFLAAFQADEPFPQVLASALTRCYEQVGWDLVTGQAAVAGVQPCYPGLEDLQSAAMTVVDEAGYGREVRDNVRGFVAVRIGSLRLGTTGRFLDGGHPIDFAALLDRNVILEIEDTGDDRDKAFLMGAVLIRLVEHLRLRSRAEGSATVRLRHLTVIEEAHRLLRQPAADIGNGPAAQSTEMFADLLAEIRAYGEGLIIAEQIPAKLIPDVIKNTAVKIVHRLPALDDRHSVGATMNLRPAQSEYLVTLRPGEAAVHADAMDYPLLVRMPDGTSREQAPATAASAETVIARRSPTCGVDCLVRACTLGEMRAAQRLTVTDPRLTMWAELAVVAHLTGWNVPRPGKVFAGEMRTMDARLRDCAISHAVDAAVAARAVAIGTRVSPPALGAHVVTVLRRLVADPASGCDDEEPQYLAPPYQWSLVVEALRAEARTVGAGRDTRSDQWERGYGKRIPGRTAAHQYHNVLRWYERDQNDTEAVAMVLWGTRQHTLIEQAVGSRVGNDDWSSHLDEMLRAFTKAGWPRKLLTRPPAGRK